MHLLITLTKGWQTHLNGLIGGANLLRLGSYYWDLLVAALVNWRSLIKPPFCFCPVHLSNQANAKLSYFMPLNFGLLLTCVGGFSQLNKNITMKKILLETNPMKFLSAALLAGMVLAFPVNAHESRIIGNLKMTVGNNPEPVFEDNIYHTDLFLNRIAVGGEVPINTDLGADISDLMVYVFIAEDDVPIDSIDDPMIIKKMKLEGIAKRRGTENRYGTPIKYTHDGAYGYYIHGTIVAGDGTVFEVDEIFVCGGGTHTPGHAFSCVKDPVTFPGKLKGKQGSKDKEGYKDSDKLSLKKDD